MSNLEYDNRLQASIDRLRAMGLKFLIQAPSKSECYLVIEMESIVKLIDRKITYPTREVDRVTQGENEYLVVHFWKGERPDNVFKP